MGDIIGVSGNTGETTNPHLHFELKKNGVPINPCIFVKDKPQECEVNDRCAVEGSSGPSDKISYNAQVPIPGAQPGNLKKTVSLVSE
jgi:murein DD-endopeptidase MepM/ murein hydrolase activator NlpD